MQIIFPDLDTSGITNRPEPFEDIGKFIKAVRKAEPGTLIILANKRYKVNPSDHKLDDDDDDQDTYVLFPNVKGTPDKPIIVMAQGVGQDDEDKKVILEGSAGYKFKNCKHLTWYGFNHRHKSSPGESSNISFVDGNNNRFARCEVNLHEKVNLDEDDEDDIKRQISKRHWLRISSSEAMKVDHCHFHHKNSEGQFCNVFLPGDNGPGNGPIFEYNYFEHQDYGEYEKFFPPDKSYGDAGGEAIQMGHSDHAGRDYRAIARYNYFEECNGDGEIVSNKSCSNIYYNNTFKDCNGSLTLRHGHTNAVLGNYFKNCGLRITGADNLIANNLSTENSRDDNRRPLIIHNGKEEGNYGRVDKNHIILNTFVNGSGTADTIVVWGSGNGSKEPTNNKFRGNIIVGKNGKLFKLNNSDPSNTITDNIGWITDDATFGDLSTQMATRVDPLLTRDEDGIYLLQSDSRARNKIQGTPFSSLTTVDIYGVTRSGNTDAGCCQFSTESTTRPKKRITPEDVGPKATTDRGSSPDWPQES